MTTSNNRREIVTKGTGHVAVATEPDMCRVPGKSEPQPFDNWVESNMLLAGRTETVLIDGEPVMVKRSELGPPSEPAHEGTLGGERSHAYRGHAMAAEWSKDVGMEGEPVVRQHDGTTHNHQLTIFNTVGILVKGDVAAMLKELYEKYGLTPRRYCGFLNGSSESERRFKAAVASEAKRLNAIAQKRGFEISADELALNFLSEGGHGPVASGQLGGIHGATVGADTLVSNLGAAGSWYPPELRNLARGGTQNSDFVNEKHENVVTLENLTLEQAVQGNASLYAWSKSQLVRDMSASGIDFAEQFYWSTVYFNAGPGKGKGMLNEHGIDLRKWTTPVIYELAYGGFDREVEPPAADARNPVGRGFARSPERLLGQPAPQIESVHGESRQPLGLGPIARHWEPSASRTGTRDERWRRERAPVAPIDFDPRANCSAPDDQWCAEPLIGDEPVEIVGATPEGLWRFRLPRYAPKFTAFVRGATVACPTHLDTFHIDCDRRRVELTWRTAVPVPVRSAFLEGIDVTSEDVLPGHLSCGFAGA